MQSARVRTTGVAFGEVLQEWPESALAAASEARKGSVPTLLSRFASFLREPPTSRALSLSLSLSLECVCVHSLLRDLGHDGEVFRRELSRSRSPTHTCSHTHTLLKIARLGILRVGQASVLRRPCRVSARSRERCLLLVPFDDLAVRIGDKLVGPAGGTRFCHIG